MVDDFLESVNSSLSVALLLIVLDAREREIEADTSWVRDMV